MALEEFPIALFLSSECLDKILAVLINIDYIKV